MATNNFSKRPTRHVQKNDTSENWSIASKNGFVPLKGELIIYNDLKNFKIGDGENTPNQLEFQRTIPGEFLENGDDGKLNVITAYEYDAGTTTEIMIIHKDEYGNYNYEGFFKPKYSIEEVISVVVVNSITKEEDAAFYNLEKDGTLYIEYYAYDIPSYFKIIYTHDAGTKSLFDDLKIPNPTIETKIENGNLYIKYNNGDFLLVGKVVGGVGTYNDFSEEEKAQLISDVLNSLPTWEGGSY